MASAPQAPPHWRNDSQTYLDETSSRSNLLVRFGIDSGPGRMVARLLVALIFFQPIYVAYGMELENPVTIPEPPAPEAVDAPEVVVVDTRADETSAAVEVVTQTDTGNTDVATDVVNDVEETGTPQADSETANTTQDQVVLDEEGNTPTTEDVPGTGETTTADEGTAQESTSGGSSGGGSTVTDVVDEGSASEESVVDPVGESAGTGTSTAGTSDTALVEEETSVASTTDVATTTQEVENVVGIIQDAENKYIFGEGDCTLVSDGEFYCVASGPERQMTGDPRVYAEKDREGDREIYYFDGVEITRITNNSYDDFAPVFDEETRRIVWQAMINDRLQIMIHEIPTNTTRQITTSRQNSSNPSIAGDTVVWQEWVDTNWEVMMTDVNNGGQDFEIERLTDNAVHDMFPAAYDDLVTWQSERGGSWEVVVYDLRTGKKHTLEKSEDTKYENPRFVLLFDSKHDNGDVETIGYDLDTGEMMELGTKPGHTPTEPVTPKKETQDALPRESASSTQLKITSREDDTHDDTIL